MAMVDTTAPAKRSGALARYRSADAGLLLARGAVAGAVAGLAFLVATMLFVETQGKPAVAPLIDISTVFRGASTPVVAPESMVIGLVTHLSLSVVFGMVFAMVVPLLSRRSLLVGGALGFGVLLYLIDFQVLGRTAFPWFTNPAGPNQLFELFVHAGFGMVLIPFFATLSRSRTAPAG